MARSIHDLIFDEVEKVPSYMGDKPAITDLDDLLGIARLSIDLRGDRDSQLSETAIDALKRHQGLLATATALRPHLRSAPDKGG